MKYEKTVTYTGEPAPAIEIVKNTFLPNGFQITESTDNSIVLTGKSLFWLQQQNNPLIGISKINVHIENSTISIKTELDNIKKVLVFILSLVLGIGLLLTIIFSIVLAGKEEMPKVFLIILLSLSPWPILAPLIFYFFKYRTKKAIDILLNNIKTSNR